jgi:hypothetical protein
MEQVEVGALAVVIQLRDLLLKQVVEVVGVILGLVVKGLMALMHQLMDVLVLAAVVVEADQEIVVVA